jgi:hypothetical protein
MLIPSFSPSDSLVRMYLRILPTYEDNLRVLPDTSLSNDRDQHYSGAFLSLETVKSAGPLGERMPIVATSHSFILPWGPFLGPKLEYLKLMPCTSHSNQVHATA